MLRLLCLAFLLHLCWGDGMPANCSDARVETCLFHYYDTNTDGTISNAEIAAFDIAATCGRVLYNMTEFLLGCDVTVDGFPGTNDGVITTFDFQGPFSCLRSMAKCTVLCMQCDLCDNATK